MNRGAAGSATETPPPTKIDRRAILIMAAVVIGTSANQIAWNIVGVALPRMQGAYSASPDQISWVMSSFVLGNTLMFAGVGWLSVRFGRRRVFLISLVVFTLTFVACGLASTLEEQVAWRFVQGLACGTMIPLGHAIATDAFPRERFGEATVIWSIGLVASGAAAPLIGAHLIDNFGWPSVFFFTMPLGVLSVIVAWAYIPETETNPGRQMDWIGLAAILVAVTAVQAILTRGQRLDWFASPEIIMAATLTAVAVYVFAVRCVTANHPFLAPALFTDLNFVLGSVIGALQGGLVMLSLVIMPLLLEGLIGYTVIDAGELLLPRGLGVIVGMALISKMSDRVDPRYPLIAGLLIIAGCSYLVSTWSLDVTARSVMLANFLLGAGGGISFVPITVLAFSTLPAKLKDEGFALFYVLYYTGVTSGIAGMLAIIARSSQISYAELGQNVTAFNKLFLAPFSSGLWSRDDAAGLAGLSDEIARQANMIAYNNGFTLSMACALAAIPLALLFRRPAAGRPVAGRPVAGRTVSSPAHRPHDGTQ